MYFLFISYISIFFPHVIIYVICIVRILFIYSQLQIEWHTILRLFLKTFDLVPDVPGFSLDWSSITLY